MECMSHVQTHTHSNGAKVAHHARHITMTGRPGKVNAASTLCTHKPFGQHFQRIRLGAEN